MEDPRASRFPPSSAGQDAHPSPAASAEDASLLDGFPFPAWKSDPLGKCVYCNDAWLRFTGRSREEALGDGWAQGVHPRDLDTLLRTVREAIGAQQPFEIEYRLRRHDGQYRWVIDRGGPSFDRDRRFTGFVGGFHDVTAQHDAEQALRNSQHLFEQFMHHIPAAAYIKDEAGVYVYMNHMAERVCALQPEAWRGKTDVQLFPPADAQVIQAADQQVIRDRETIQSNRTIMHPDGARTWLAIKFPIFTLEDKTLVAGISTDITEQQRSQEALRDSEERFRKLFEDSPLGIAIADLDRRFVAVNDALCRMVGYERHELLGMSVEELTSPEDREESAARNAALMRGEVSGFKAERRYLHRNGGVVWVQLTISLIRDSHGNPLHAVGVIENVTGQKWNAEELNRATQTLEALIEQSPMSVILFDVDARVRRWNPAAQEIFGWTQQEVLGRRLDELPGYFRPDSEEVWKRVIDGEEIRGKELIRQRKDGSKVEIALWTALFRDELGKVTGVLSLAGDITEQKHLKDHLLHAQKMESIGRLAGGVAHDFNNLLAVISGYSEALLRRAGDDDSLRSHVEEIHRAAIRGAALTRQLLAFSRRQAISPQLLDLNKLVLSVHQMLRRLIGERIDVAVEGADEPRWVRADPTQMEQVLLNLSLNARDAMNENAPGTHASPDALSGDSGGRGRLTLATTTVSLDAPAAAHEGIPPGRYVRLTVRDTGHGMDPETRSRIFEPFFSTKEGRGTGLGLSIVYGVVQQCGGSISVQSEVRRGTQFHILLPAAPPPDSLDPP